MKKQLSQFYVLEIKKFTKNYHSHYIDVTRFETGGSK